MGSSPTLVVRIRWGVSLVGKASGWQSEDREFESRTLHVPIKIALKEDFIGVNLTRSEIIK